MPSPHPALYLSLCIFGLAIGPGLASSDQILLISADTSTPSYHNIPLAEEDPEFGLLFVARGVEETFYTCSACHSERIVAQQGLNRDRWTEMLEWMVDEQGMAEIEEPDLSEILDYLTANYNVERPNFPRPKN